MTRKDYIATANILNALGRKIEAHTVERKAFIEAVDRFCDLFALDNPRFNEDRFREAVDRA